MDEITVDTISEIRARSEFGSANWDDPITDARTLLEWIERLNRRIAAADVGWGHVCDWAAKNEAAAPLLDWKGLAEILYGKPEASS